MIKISVSAKIEEQYKISRLENYSIDKNKICFDRMMKQDYLMRQLHFRITF